VQLQIYQPTPLPEGGGNTGLPRDDGLPYTDTGPAACPGVGDTGAARDDGIPYTP